MMRVAGRRLVPDSDIAAFRRSGSGFWPNRRHETLLAAALLEPPAAVRALERWQTGLDLRTPDYATLTILPQLYANLVRHELAPELREQLRGVHRWSWHRNRVLIDAVAGALDALKRAGIDVMVMKGVPLALTCYSDAGARVMGDGDLVVRARDVRGAVAVLAGCGWTPERSIDDGLLKSVGGVNLRDRGGRVIDLCWHVLPDSYDAAQDEALWKRAGRIEVGSVDVAVLDPSDHLLEVVCHGLSWAANAPLHWVCDALLLVRRHQSEPFWERLVQQARENRRVQTVRAGLHWLVDRFSVPVPPAALAALAAEPGDRTERIGFWFAEHAGRGWPWGRAPLVLASYLRSCRAHGIRPGPAGFAGFLGARAGCAPRQLPGRFAAAAWRALRSRPGALRHSTHGSSA